MSDLVTSRALSPSPEQGPACTANTSSIYTMIPSAVRSRIPILASFSQRASVAVPRPVSHGRSWSAEGYLSSASSPNQSRRTSISSADTIVSATATPRPVSPVDTRQALVATSQPHTPAAVWEPAAGGIDWATAATGVRLWLSAREQAELATRNPALLRSMHIDATKYMMLSLPADLSPAEVETLRVSLPASVNGLTDGSHQTMLASKPNVLRQSIAQVVYWSVAFILFVVPLMMTVLDRVLTYEREHRVARRVLDNSAQVTKTLSGHGLDCGEAMLRYKDTPMGRAFFQALSWTIEGVVGGLNDGILQSTDSRARP